jgi:hypothetical protein
VLPVDGVLDIETSKWDRFTLGGLLFAGSRAFESYRDPSALVERLLTLGGTWWTWNGGLFDTLWLGDMLEKLGVYYQAAQAGPRVTRLECEGLVVRDAIALIPMKLEKAAKIAGIELAKDTGLPCICPGSVRCGGYCSIDPSMSADHFRRLDAYLKLDCVAELEVIETVMREADRCEYLLSGTVGGTSYRTLAARAGIDKAEWELTALYRFARAAYFGGRTEVFRPRAAEGFAYDINSAYPAALCTVDLPTGSPLRCKGDKARRAYLRGKEGIYLARVEVPADLHLPPLPIRTPRGRVCFPTGLLRGAWTGLELRGAEIRGARVSIDSALVWSDAEPVLMPALRHVWDCRARAKAEGNPTLSEWHKWVGNSGTGKLAEAPEKERVIVNPRDDEVITHEPGCDCSPRFNGCRAWRPLDRKGKVWAIPFYRISDCAHVHWAAYLTAWTRLTWLDQAEADGDGGRSMVYGDTDSIFTTIERTRNIGDDLGQWGSEGRWRDFHAMAPKLYRYWSEAKEKWIVRGKGLPGLDSEGFTAFGEGAPHRIDRGVMSLRQAAKSGRGLFVRKAMERRNHADGVHFGSRVLKRDNLTHPRNWREILSWERNLRPRRSARI